MLSIMIEQIMYSFKNGIHCIGQLVTKNGSVIFRCIFLKTHFEENGHFWNAITLKWFMIFEISQVFGEDEDLI